MIKHPPRTGHFINESQVMAFQELPEKEGSYDAGILLAYNGECKEFCVWLYVCPPEHHHRKPYCVDGGYHSDVEDALLDYLRRIHASRVR